MKTIRLLYSDHVSGGLDTYYFGANLLQHILPQNPRKADSFWQVEVRNMLNNLKEKYEIAV